MLYLRAGLLAPGIMLHEFSHHILCLLSGVKVRKVVYFRIGNPAGFVIHEEPELYRQIFAIVAGPVFINSAVSVVLFNLSLRQWARAMASDAFAVAALMALLALSVGLQAIPSRGDATNLFHSSTRHVLRGNPFAIVGYPVGLAIYLVQLARPLGSEWFYTVFMAYLAYRGFATV